MTTLLTPVIIATDTTHITHLTPTTDTTWGKFMPTLYIRGFPAELLKELKVRAAKEGKTLKAICIEKLETVVDTIEVLETVGPNDDA